MDNVLQTYTWTSHAAAETLLSEYTCDVGFGSSGKIHPIYLVLSFLYEEYKVNGAFLLEQH